MCVQTGNSDVQRQKYTCISNGCAAITQLLLAGFQINSGMRKFRIGQDFLIEYWHMIYIMQVVFAEIYF